MSVRDYDPISAGVDNDLTLPIGPMAPVLAKLDPLLRTPIDLSPQEFHDLVDFVRDGLLDERAKKENLCKLVPRTVPSGSSVLHFERCPRDTQEQHPSVR
jgi:cytochrome c peroxidase